VKQSAVLRRNWLTFAVLGLILTGLGLSLVGEAVIAKMAQQAYVLLGTAGLVAFNAGLSIFGQAVIYRYRYLKAHGREEKPLSTATATSRPTAAKRWTAVQASAVTVAAGASVRAVRDRATAPRKAADAAAASSRASKNKLDLGRGIRRRPPAATRFLP